MRKSLMLIAAATLSFSTVAFADHDSGKNSSGSVTDANWSEMKGARHVLARVVEDSTMTGKYSDLTMNLAKADRDRIVKSDKINPELEAAITQFQKDWKAKYGSDFAVRSHFREVFSGGFVQVTGPSIFDDAQTAGEKITGNPNDAGPKTTGSGAAAVDAGQHLSDGVKRSGDKPRTTETGNPNVAGPKSEGSGAEATGTNVSGTTPPQGINAPAPAADGKANTAAAGPRSTGSGAAAVDAGHNDFASDAGGRTTVTIPASHGAPAVTLNLLNEDGKLRVDIPDSIDGAQLQSNIARHLGMVCENKANWPADANEASRVVTHHVLLALVDTSNTK